MVRRDLAPNFAQTKESRGGFGGGRNGGTEDFRKNRETIVNLKIEELCYNRKRLNSEDSKKVVAKGFASAETSWLSDLSA
jgi:hypothetical protein